ncbi:uncharacterized protein BT62DRAFT_195457 [Guyanagaster necrorhizus]|uniref:Uncharacterized protein n=1 Tax=Guyanagaster necrorhizus TaxID=856835 RepID=A0A9P7VQB4_9AGAR|nr:uncharacterized protein BT62DRAFT_195457 [Guyanagaster necrorhizus MCA 3950]KAG7445453.1 hypothetical protein BT62DRAFT_195457 [Guyanagaster necrorhizus MCA 3950]
MIPSRWERTRRMSTVYINGQGGHIVMGKLFLDKEEWLRKPSLLERSTRCSGCLGIINFEEDYDVDVWTRHRDSCRGIEERMMITIARALEFPARDMDVHDSGDAFCGPDDGWEPVKQSVLDEKWHTLKEILSDKSAEEAEENGSKTVTFVEIEDCEDVEEDVDDTDGSCIRYENEAYSEGKGSDLRHDFSVPTAGPA